MQIASMGVDKCSEAIDVLAGVSETIAEIEGVSTHAEVVEGEPGFVVSRGWGGVREAGRLELTRVMVLPAGEGIIAVRHEGAFAEDGGGA
jgi:hypothetical protein